MPLPDPNTRSAQRLRTAADRAQALEAALPRAWREEGLPGLPELAAHATAIRDHHQQVLDSAAALTSRPHPTTADRAETRALSTAAEHLGAATAAISRAATMAARLHEADGLGSPRAAETRERATQHLNLGLSHARLALRETTEQLRRDAVLLTGPDPERTARRLAAISRTTSPNARVLVSPARTADMPRQAAGRRR
ncbi:hypothetical protein [Kitasatospora sp. NPDC127116]|uniref:hypothetical protein n=1 Tax=Kitasatospora sp. NPDC127116 TaxID=3345367 RepID=UPI0036414CAF